MEFSLRKVALNARPMEKDNLMIRSVLGCIGLGITLFLVAAHADSILRVNDPVLGNPTATITGQVTNSRGKLLDGAIVEATSLESQLIVGAKTNKDGSYRMALLPPGTYRVAARMAGFRTVSNPSFKVGAQDKIALNFCMDCGAVPNSSSGGGGGTGAGATGGGSSMRTGTTTQSIVNNPLTLGGSASLVPNSNINEALQLQLGVNGSTQLVPGSLNSSMSYGISGNLHADSYDHVSSLKGDDDSLLNLSGNDSGSVLALGQLNTIPPRPIGSELAGGYGLLSVSFPANSGDGAGISWKVAGSDNQLEGAQSTEKIIVSGSGKRTGDPSENTSSQQFVAALDSEGNGKTELTVSIVSEPSCLLMMGSGMIGLAILTRRYKHKM
jgi:hypothetical protein